MAHARPDPLVHLELHTGNLARACGFYAQLAGWRAERVETRSGSYLALDLGPACSGGVVECDTPRAMWLPYVEVGDVSRATRRAVELGATVVLGPREGPAGWRSVVVAPEGGDIGLWQPKR
jgi:predicted enzyme related to lactoylglutathione lyase